MLIHYKDITNVVKKYLSKEQLASLDKAFKYALQAHKGQKRASGEDYIHHPLAVAMNLAIHRASANTLIAGLLHDVVEDCNISLAEIKQEFGDDIAALVDGVTKIDSLTNTKRSNISASNIKKILLSGVSDVRVLIIKLCDRLHNIQTLDALSDEKKQRIARETLEIYSPLALKLSLFDINKAYEEEAFKWAFPKENQFIEDKLKRAKTTAFQIHSEIIAKINQKLKEVGIKSAVVLSRQKTNYSIYKKIYQKGKRWEKLFDLLAVRIIVKDISECFSVLGLMHNNFKHIPKTFKDYITIPKANGYQSLHTCLSYQGFIFEAQIRTNVMNQKANIGIASTWTYKDNEKTDMLTKATEAHSWIQDIQNLSNEKLKDKTFVENVYSNITTRNIYTFTPDNEIIIINRGATVIDFAYKVHTKLGDHFNYAVVNNQRVDFDHELTNGSVVEIFTSDEIRTVNKWLSAAKTKYAYSKIKKSLKTIEDKHKSKYAKIGEQILSKFLTKKELKRLDNKKIGTKFELDLDSHKDIYEAIGRKIISYEDIPYIVKLSKNRSINDGLNDLFIVDDKSFTGKIKIAKCCKPIPGDIITGIKKRNILSAHRIVCHNNKDNKNKNFNIAWKNIYDKSLQPFNVELYIRYNPSELAINAIINRVIRNKININKIKSKTKNKELILVVDVYNLNQLSLLISAIQSLAFVREVFRYKV